MTSGGQVFCCGARNLTKLFAWIQIVSYSTGLILLVIVVSLLTIAKTNAETEKQIRLRSGGSKASLNQSKYVNSMGFTEYHFGNIGLTSFVVLYLLTGVLLLIGVVTGVYLLKGAQENNTLYLKGWMVFAVGVVLWFVTLTYLCYKRDGVIIALIRIVISVGIYGFQGWVVWTLIKAIEVELGLRYERNNKKGNNVTHPIIIQGTSASDPGIY